MGSGWNDAVLFAEAWRRARDGGDLARACRTCRGAGRLAGASCRNHAAGRGVPGSRRRMAASGLAGLPKTAPMASRWGRPPVLMVYLRDALPAFLQASLEPVQVAIRLGVTGQNGAVAVLAAFEPMLLETRARANSTLDDLGSATCVRHHGDEARNAIFEAVPLMICSGDCRPGAFVIAALHAYWGFGGVWPGTDAASCARTVGGFPGRAECRGQACLRSPPRCRGA